MNHVVGPDLAGKGRWSWYLLGVGNAAAATLRFAHLQLRLLPEALDPLVIDHPPLATQQRPDPTVAIAGMLVGQASDPLTQRIIGSPLRLILHARAIGRHQHTGAPFRDSVLDQELHRRPLIGRLHRFFASNSFLRATPWWRPTPDRAPP